MNAVLIITLGIVGLLGGWVYFNYRKLKNLSVESGNEKIVNITDNTFQSQINKGVTLVDFWASWCMPCKMMIPVLNDVADLAPTNATIAKIDVETNQKMASTHKVRNIPTMILFKDGKEISRFVGVKSKDFLLKEINKHV